MASKRVVSCIAHDPAKPSGGVAAIGGVHPDGRCWSLSVEAAMAGIDRGEWVFYVELAAGLVPITVSATESGDRSLSAHTDDARTDHLAALQECPRSGPSTA